MGLQELLITAFVAGVITDLSTGLGAVPFFFVKDLSRTINGIFLAAAAGMMTSASLVQLVGEGLKRDGGSAIWLVSGGLVAGSLFFAIASKWLHANEDFDFLGLREKGGTGALLVVLAMTVHSLPEGVAIGVGFATMDAANVGIPVALAIAVHNVPEGLAIALALRPRGVSTWACIGWAILSSAPQPIGAVPAAWAVWMAEPLLPFGMGFAAGAMMHLVVSDLLPEASEQARSETVGLSFLAGIVLMILLGAAVGLG